MASSLATKNTLQNTGYGTLNAHAAESTSLLPFKLDVPYKTIQNDNERYYVSKIQSLSCVQLLYKFIYSYFWYLAYVNLMFLASMRHLVFIFTINSLRYHPSDFLPFGRHAFEIGFSSRHSCTFNISQKMSKYWF